MKAPEGVAATAAPPVAAICACMEELAVFGSCARSCTRSSNPVGVAVVCVRIPRVPVRVLSAETQTRISLAP